MRVFAFTLAILIAISLVGCQNQGQPESVPPSGSEGGVVLESQGSAETPEEPSPAEMEAAQGVEVRFLAAFPSLQQITRPILRSVDRRIWDGCLRVEVADRRYSGSWDLLSFDLGTGEQVFSLPLNDYRDISYDLRQMGSGEFSIFTADDCRRYGRNGELLSFYSLPEAARIGKEDPFYDRYRYQGSCRWDVLPEKDLLAWCGPEGLWAADSAGEDPRLVLAAEAIGQQPEFAELVRRYLEIEELEPWEQVSFFSVRIMRGGETLSADFGSPQSQIGRQGHVAVSLADGTAFWYHPYVVGAEQLEYLDDTTLIAGVTRIDTATGETSRAAREELGKFSTITGDFSRYYGVEQNDTEYRLLCYDIKDRTNIKCLLTLPRRLETAATDDIAYMRFYPMAVEGNKVVCYYQLPKEEGLMLVTVPEE